MIEPQHPLGVIAHRGRQPVRGSKGDAATVPASNRVSAESERKRVGEATQVSQRIQVKVKTRIGGEQQPQAGHCFRRRQDKPKLPGGTKSVLLEGGKKEGFVLPYRAAQSEAVDILANPGGEDPLSLSRLDSELKS